MIEVPYGIRRARKEAVMGGVFPGKAEVRGIGIWHSDLEHTLLGGEADHRARMAFSPTIPAKRLTNESHKTIFII
jgi:hypothetical protein